MSFHEVLLEETSKAHQEAERLTEEAREAVRLAIEARQRAGAMVEKGQRMHKGDVLGYFRDVMPSQQVKDYMSIHHASQRRELIHDKRILQICGILDKGQTKRPPIGS